MNSALKILSATKPPTQEFINEESINEAMDACPLLGSIYHNRTKDPFYSGLTSALSTIYDALSSAGEEMVMTELSQEGMVETDDAMTRQAEDLVADLPYVQEVMGEEGDGPTASTFRAGVVLGFVVVAEKLKGKGEEKEEEAPKVEAPEPDEVPTAESYGDLTAVLYSLRQAGLSLDGIKITPEVIDGNIKLAIRGSLGNEPDFETIAKLNAMFLTIGGRGIQLKTESPIEFYFEV